MREVVRTGVRRTAGAVAGAALIWAFATGATQEGGEVPDQASERIERYRAAAADSDEPIDQYNLGTALLLEGQVAQAQPPLQASLRADRPLVRRSGYYNYGLSTALDARLGQADPTARRTALLAAREAFREVLRQEPADEDARWNLEIIERWLEQEEDASGGQGSQGGSGESPPGTGAGGAPSGAAGQDQMLSPEEAAALLEQAGEAEASIRDRVMGRNRFRDPVVERNW